MKFKMFIVMALLCMVTTVPGFMQDTVDFKTEAEALKSLGLFSGTNNGFELDRAPSRVEAAAMLVKLLGAKMRRKQSITNTHSMMYLRGRRILSDICTKIN